MNDASNAPGNVEGETTPRSIAVANSGSGRCSPAVPWFRSTPSKLDMVSITIHTFHHLLRYATTSRARPVFCRSLSRRACLLKMPGLAYDDSGVLAAYFGLTCLSFVLLPATFVTLRKSLVGDEKSRAAKNECSCQECRAKVKSIKKAEAKSIFSKRYVRITRPRSHSFDTSIDTSPCSSDG